MSGLDAFGLTGAFVVGLAAAAAALGLFGAGWRARGRRAARRALPDPEAAAAGEPGAPPANRRAELATGGLDALFDRGLLLVDRDLVIVLATEGAAQQLGERVIDLEGRSLQDLCDAPSFKELAARAAERRRARVPFVVDVDFVTARRCAATVDAAWPAAPVDGLVLLLSPRAGTPSESSAAALARYRSIVDGLADGVFVVCDGVVIESNPQARAWLGEQLDGRALRDLVSAEDLLLVLDRISRAESGEDVEPVTCRLAAAAGRERELEFFVSPVVLDGRCAAAVTLRDLGPERRAERRARIQEARLLAIIEAIADGVVLLAPPAVEGSPWRVGLVNRRLLEVLGLEGARTLGVPEEEFRAIAALRFAEPAVFAGLFETAARQPLREHVASCELDDGSTTLEFIVRPVLGPDGTLLGRLAVARDITRHREVERQLTADAAALGRSRETLQRACEQLSAVNQDLERKTSEADRLNRELLELDQARAQLLGDVSHELQTPLVSIRGYTQMVLDGRLGKINDEQRRGLDVALRNVDRMVELINNLLALARSERRAPVQPEAVDPSAVVRDVLERQQDAAREKQVQLEARVDEPGALVAAERDALVQVLDNLVGNGIKFNRAGGRVTVSIEPGPAGFVQIDVTDTGIGVPPEDRERVFERFYRGRTAAGIPGTGIGLATVRNLVRRHGGVVELRSDGHGSSFRILWPRAPSAIRSATQP